MTGSKCVIRKISEFVTCGGSAVNCSAEIVGQKEIRHSVILFFLLPRQGSIVVVYSW